MFEGSTEKARRVIFFARYEASQYAPQPGPAPSRRISGCVWRLWSRHSSISPQF
jgi:hypothetical protein